MIRIRENVRGEMQSGEWGTIELLCVVTKSKQMMIIMSIDVLGLHMQCLTAAKIAAK